MGKTQTTNQRNRLLSVLRAQRDRIGPRAFVRAEAPELYDLAIAVDNVRRGTRTVLYCGVRFPLKFGWRRYICDPDTGETLTGGGFLA